MMQAPWTEIGSLQSEVREIKSTLNQKADSHEISTLNSRVDSLEGTLAGIGSTLDGIQSQLQVIQEGLRQASGY